MPVHPVLYWRDTTTKASDSLYDTLDELIAAKPLQVLLFEDVTTDKQIEVIIESGDDPVTNEPGLNPVDGTITVNKQQGRSPVPTLTIQGTVDIADTTWRDKARDFAAKRQIEHSYHKKGIIGFFHPEMTDFNVDPTDQVGYTMSLPFFQYNSPGRVMTFRFNLSKGE